MAQQQFAPPREGLIPKRIIDVNGHPKTVYVKPDSAAAGRSRLADAKPTLKANFEQNLRDLRDGNLNRPSEHTDKEKAKAAERGYGSEKLREAALHRYQTEFGIPLSEAPAVEIDDERLYDYISRGLTVEQAHEFARFGIEPHLSHPKLDAEYVFISGPKVAKADLRQQLASDSPARKKEQQEVYRTARLLQENGVGAHVAAACLANGLRTEHLRNPKIDPMEAIKVSSEHSVDSKRFKALAKENTPGKLDRAMARMRASVGRRLKLWARRLFRRLLNGFRRRMRRILRKTFLPWEVR